MLSYFALENMKLSRAKVLIMFLFNINAAFPETAIEITRKMPSSGPGWKDGTVDSFQIPQWMCPQGSSGNGNICNYTPSASCTKDDTDDRYSCQCTEENATVTYLNNRWRCLGCQTNDLFVNEEKEHRLRTLNTALPAWRKTKLNERQANCKVNVSSSWYIGCDGEMVPLERQTNKTTDIFRLQWISSLGWWWSWKPVNAYCIKVFEPEPIDFFLGRVINLGINCNSESSIGEGCLLFKLEGILKCPVSRPTSTIVSTTINPTMSSRYLELTSPSKTISNTPTALATNTQFSNTATALSVSPTQVNSWKASSSTTIGSTQATTPPGSGRKQKNAGDSSSSSLGIIAGLTASVTLVLLLIAALFIYRRRKSRKDAHSSTSGRIDKKTVARNTKTNPAFQLEEQNVSVISHDRKKTIAPVYTSRYAVPQQQMSSEENSQSGGLYAALDVPEGNNIYGHREVVSQNGLSAEHPVYNVLEDLSVKDSKETSNHGPYQPVPVYNVLEDPYAEASEEPAWYGSTPVDDPVYNTLEEPGQYTGCEPVYNVLEDPDQSGAGDDDCYGPSGVQDPVYNVLERPDPKSSENGAKCQDTVNTNIPVYAVVDKKKKTKG